MTKQQIIRNNMTKEQIKRKTLQFIYKRAVYNNSAYRIKCLIKNSKIYR